MDHTLALPSNALYLVLSFITRGLKLLVYLPAEHIFTCITPVKREYPCSVAREVSDMVPG